LQVTSLPKGFANKVCKAFAPLLCNAKEKISSIFLSKATGKHSFQTQVEKNVVFSK